MLLLGHAVQQRVNTYWVWHTQVIKLYEPTNQPISSIWYTFSGSEQTRKCIAVILFLIKCCMQYAVIFYDTQFYYVGTYYNYCMINYLLCGETKIFNETFKIDNYVKPCT